MSPPDSTIYFANGSIQVPESNTSGTSKMNHSASELPVRGGLKAMAALAHEFTGEDRINKLESRIARMENMLISPAMRPDDGFWGGPGPAICSGDTPKRMESSVNEFHKASENCHSSPERKLNRYMPLAIRKLPPYATVQLCHSPIGIEQLKTFPLSFLTSILGGEEFSPGLYFTKKQSYLFKGPTYYIIDRGAEPYLPLVPGDHGAKLSVFFNSFDDDGADQYTNVPLFISACSSTSADAPVAREYHYFGQYSQLRWSDRLDCDRIQEVVPLQVKNFWAELLAAKSRPEWLTLALMEHFWPKPVYEGEVSGENGANVKKSVGDDKGESENAGTSGVDRVQRDMAGYVGELGEWQRMARMKASLLTKENILRAFELEDAGAEPGLRFWWEYLECVGFDRSFYYQLATEKKNQMAVESSTAD